MSSISSSDDDGHMIVIPRDALTQEVIEIEDEEDPVVEIIREYVFQKIIRAGYDFVHFFEFLKSTQKAEDELLTLPMIENATKNYMRHPKKSIDVDQSLDRSTVLSLLSLSNHQFFSSKKQAQIGEKNEIDVEELVLNDQDSIVDNEDNHALAPTYPEAQNPNDAQENHQELVVNDPKTTHDESQLVEGEVSSKVQDLQIEDDENDAEYFEKPLHFEFKGICLKALDPTQRSVEVLGYVL